MVVFFSMSLVMTPPSVSIPSDRGVTSRRSTSLTSPPKTPACTAAPIATASSGLTSFLGSFPKNSPTTSCTFGIRVCPPTKITSLISEAANPASFKATCMGSTVLEIRSSTKDSSLALEIFTFKCLGPPESAVI